MDHNTVKDRIRNSIYSSEPDAEVYLFGSRARGDFETDSDWDILILIDEEQVTNEIEDKFREGLYDLELEAGQIISTFIYPKSFWSKVLIYSPLYENINREGVRL